MDFLKDFLDKTYEFLTNQPNFSEKCSLIRKSPENCDFTFAITFSYWKKFIKTEVQEDVDHKTDNILNYRRPNKSKEQVLEELIKESANWRFPIQKALVSEDRCLIFLDRQKSMAILMSSTLSGVIFVQPQKIEEETINLQLQPNEISSISDLRAKLMYNVTRNLVECSPYTLVDEKEDAKHKFVVTTKSNFSKNDDRAVARKKILCGVVVDPKNGNKVAEMSAEDYRKKRSNDINLMAQHKYGLRVKNEAVFIELIEKLGNYAVIVDLLEVKVTSPVSLNWNSCASGSSKGASFILYNSARLESLLDNFDSKVKSGYYPKLPEFEDIDVGLLKEEEEWRLAFNYILTFPDLVKRCTCDLLEGKVHIYLICIYLSGFVGIFSVYYRRVRLLTENRTQLLPFLFAKIYLLKCLRIVFNKALALLDIHPIKYM